MKIPFRRKVIGKVKTVYRTQFGFPVVYDVCSAEKYLTKRALLVYLVEPFLQKSKQSSHWHSNWTQNLDIAEILTEFGYIVDVINWNDLKSQVKYSYDLVLGIGSGIARLTKELPESVFKIYIATGSEKMFNNKQEHARIDAVKKRRGCELKPRRTISFETENLQYFDEIICLGNDYIAETYRIHHPNVYIINNYAFQDLPNPARDISKARYHFMYLASGGQIHKGLDLLLEVFAKNPHLHLHICAPFMEEKDFAACYDKELFHTPNIHPVGWVDVYGKKFAELCRKCAFSILPSCAEGQVGSVIMCMYSGMIPIISKACGIDTKDFGILLANCEISFIERVVNEVVEKPVSWLQEKSSLTREAALKDYSPEAFRARWREILNVVLNKPKKENSMVLK